jgi:alkylation response protein AidB-like acyl-CoA dehydrogenase
VAHSYLAMTHLNAEGDERIKQDYLLPLQKNWCFVYIRTFSDGSYRTNAVLKGDKYVINGSKLLLQMGCMQITTLWLQKQVLNLNVTNL